MKYTKAVIRQLSHNYKLCVSDFPDHHLLNVEKAKDQHSQYVKILSDLGLEIIRIEGNDNYPDCCFVEDTAVIHRKKAVINSMGIESRKGETNAVRNVLSQYLELTFIENPGTVEGGDIIHIDHKNLLICGVSKRSNSAGVMQLGEKLNCSIQIVEDPEIVHLKSYITYLGDDTMLLTKKYADHQVLSNFIKIVVPKQETYAANSLTINEQVIIPKGYPLTQDLLKNHGFETISLNMSEFQKCEGSLTCLSLLF